MGLCKMNSCLKKFVILAFISFFSVNTVADQTMNELKLSQFGDFVTNWKLVTVRYRKDSEEMRFTYSNDLAWNALSKNLSVYPDGAIFAKVSFVSVEDPLFPSSAVPAGARRIQFMVRDEEKYKSTNGWGYALFDSEGNTYPGDMKAATMGCAVCHDVAKERGYVFSQIMGQPLSKDVFASSWRTQNKFVDFKVKSLPLSIQQSLPRADKKVRKLEGPLADYIFFGTLDEIKPLLAKEAIESKMTTLLLSKDNKSYSLVTFDTTSRCEKDEVALIGKHSINSAKVSYLETRFCAKAKNP